MFTPVVAATKPVIINGKQWALCYFFSQSFDEEITIHGKERAFGAKFIFLESLGIVRLIDVFTV